VRKCGTSDLEWREWPVGIWVWLYLAPTPAKPSHLNIHQPTIGLISKRIKMGVWRQCNCTLDYCDWRTANSPFRPGLFLGVVQHLEHRIPDTEKQEFPATTILMCFKINYYFAINSVYQRGGGQLKKPNEQVTRHTNQM